MTPARPAIPRGIWVLGFVSMLMDISSEMVHSLLPMFLVGSLGVSVLVVGLIEGLAEATALITTLVTLRLASRMQRKLFWMRVFVPCTMWNSASSLRPIIPSGLDTPSCPST
jgi:hypothetical protein